MSRRAPDPPHTGSRIRRWGAIARQTYRELQDDQVGIVASGVAFRVAIAIFPGIALLVWIGIRLIGPQEAHALVAAMSDVVPDSSRAIIENAVRSSVDNNPADKHPSYNSLGRAAPYAALLFMLYSTNSGMKALFTALNVIYDKTERRGFLRFNAVTLLFTVGLIVTIFSATAVVVATPWLLELAGLSGTRLLGLALLRWPVMFLGVAVALAILYRFAPNRERESWPLVTFGSSLAALLIVLCSTLFSWFTDRFASLAVTYGSLSTIMAFMLWLWVIFLIVLACAELDSCIAQETGIYGGPDAGGAGRNDAHSSSVRSSSQPFAAP